MNKKHKSGSGAVNGLFFGPKSDWEPPKKFPNLKDVTKLGVDVETRDPNLMARGPGEIRGDGYVCGISLATYDESWYFPIAHLDGGNMDRGAVISFVRDTLKDPDMWCLTANGQYDIGWLKTLGVDPKGRFLDVQVAEALIDEEQESYALEALCRKYGLEGKNEELLKKAGDAYGSTNIKGDLWKFHSKYVGPYAEFDTLCLHDISLAQFEEMKKQNLLEIFQLECRLMPILCKMRKRGVRIDAEKAQKLSEALHETENKLRDDLKAAAGRDIDVWSGNDIAYLCESKGIYFPKTARGNPSFEGEWLDNQELPVLGIVSDLRKTNKLRKTFVNDWILKNLIGDRIHPNWRQTRTEEGGTRSGRFSANNPNPQQIPAAQTRKGVPSPVAKLIREVFIPEEGFKWFKGDWSQQEPRVLTHFAAATNKTGAKLAELAYIDNPNMDFYQFMMDAAGINRRFAKDMYLGRCYGMGKDKMAAKVNMTTEAAQKALAEVDVKVPFIKEMADTCMQLAAKRGWIRTILGRKCHFDYWEPVDSWDLGKTLGHRVMPVRTQELAAKTWPGHHLRRANTHKALNRLIQGSAADLMKISIVRCHEEHNWFPYLTVHDELDGPVIDENDSRKICGIMRNPIDQLKIPMKVDVSIGEGWK